MEESESFGYWIRRRRKALDLTQDALAWRVGYSLGAIRKLEADERRPSPELAERLAQVLELPPDERARFLKVARADLAVDRLSAPTDSVDLASPRPAGGPPALPASHVPLPLTPFIGREREVSALQQRLQDPLVRLVTLTGPGGTGKTRLALQVAAELHAAFGDGVFVVALAPIRDPARVALAIARTLGVREAPPRPLWDSLQDELRAKRLLLVLDNFEHVVAAAPFLAEVLAAAPHLTMLVTSREVLRLSGEHVFPVPPLTLPDPQALPPLERLAEYEAVRLFSARAQAAHASFAVTAANAPAIAAICYRLDGLPLAIELAAARVRLLPPPALLARLTSRLGLLTSGARDLPARQQTLRSTLDWSYALLPPGEQTLFARLGVFVGGATLEAAEAVCTTGGDPPIEVLDGLAALVDKSLAQQVAGPAGEPRFTMLETIREYALDRLEASGALERVRKQHAIYYLHLAELAAPRLTGEERRTWLDRLEAERDNLRAALAWSAAQPAERDVELRLVLALYRFWEERGPISEGLGWLQRALTRTDALQRAAAREQGSREETLLLARALLAAGDLAGYGDVGAARAYGEASLALFRTLGDTNGLARALLRLGGVAQMEGDHAAACALTEEGVALLWELGDRANLPEPLFQLAFLARMQGDYPRAAAGFAEVVAVAREVGDQEYIAWGLLDLGTVALHQGDPARAVPLMTESVALFAGERNKRGHGWALIHLAEALRVAGAMQDPEGAGDAAQIDELLAEGLALIREGEGPRSVAQALLEVGEVAFEAGDEARAAALLAESLAVCKAIGDREGVANVLDMFAGLAAGQGRTERAARLWGAAEQLHDPGTTRLSPIRRTRYAGYRAAAHAQRAAAPFTQAWAEGQAMALEQAVAYALEET